MSSLAFNSPTPATGSMTITLIGTVNMAPTPSWTLPTSTVCSYTTNGEMMAPCAPLSDGARRLGNSILSARVSEEAILRDGGDF